MKLNNNFLRNLTRRLAGFVLFKQTLRNNNMTPYEIPIVSISIPGVGEIRAGGLVVVVGPNSSGKTQFLRDVSGRLTGQPRELVVCDSVRLRKPQSLDAFVQSLTDHGAIIKTNVNNAVQLNAAVSHFGMGAALNDVNLNEADSWYNAFPYESADRTPAPGDYRFLQHFGPMLSTALFLENRSAATNATNSFDYLSQKPSNDLQALHLNSEAQDKLRAEVRETFGKALGVDPTRHGILAIRISDLPEPPPRDWISPNKVRNLRGIESEGDGIRSYCAVCIALLLGTRPACFIDEPELCLHPPQAHAIGRFIGKYGAREDTTTFVSTHSSQVLRGILETAGNNLRIIRLVRVGKRFIGHLVDQEIIRASLKRPAARSEVILEGIFADAVAIVEADTDRVVYQTAMDFSERAVRRDGYFAVVGGIGGIADTARFYHTLRIPVAVIADLDLIRKPADLERIAEALTDKKRATPLRKACEDLLKEIRRVPPELSESQVIEKLTALINAPMDWSKNHDEPLANDLRRLGNAIDRMRRLKSGGVRAFDKLPGLKSQIEGLIQACSAIGLFLVPVGELEHWSPELMKNGPSREKKAEWTNEFVERIQQQAGLAKDVIEFVKAVDAFHGAEAERLTAAALGG